MQLWSDRACKAVYEFLQNNTFCAGYRSGYIANCVGDSGGPLMCEDRFKRYKLVGVFSFLTVQCDLPMRPPVFGRVSSLLPWIRNATECKLRCDNEKCIFDERDFCNGVDDCGGDYSDETYPCGTHLECNFEKKFTCGYAPTSSLNKWSRKTAQDLKQKNTGPLYDHTLRDERGHFMYADSPRSLLTSPVYRKNSSHCMGFHYHMRSTDAGYFRVYSTPYSANVSRGSTLSQAGTMVLYSVKGNQGDRWIAVNLDVTAGTFIFTFEAIALPGRALPHVALDDVTILEGTCASQVCHKDFQCHDSRSCISNERRCDVIMDCADSSDEINCFNYSYSCSFEQYGLCGFEQSVEDTFDWTVITVSNARANGPLRDNTIGNETGRVAYINAHGGTGGNEASMRLRTSPRSLLSCLVLHYSMVSTATLSVVVATTKQEASVYWSISNTSTETWQRVEMSLDKTTTEITIKATLGARLAAASRNYIAIDDVIITEEPCNKTVCRPGQFHCKDGGCIDASKVCNNVLDCKDNSDEQKCDCKRGEFQCGNGLCIPEARTCDGINDCLDRSDESANCTCFRHQFQCSDGRCMVGYRWCDGYNDCDDWSDEPIGCECREEQFRCREGTCIPGTRWCDGYIDCPNSADEPLNCSCASKWTFPCKNGKCVSMSAVCDSVDNCGDQSDEEKCPCRASDFTCGDGQCIRGALYCDGYPDCADGGDETEDCSCGAGRFQCTRGGCIPRSRVCDRRIDCRDATDELNCECSDQEFRCGNGLCVPRSKVCDGFVDCQDKTDELKCTCFTGEFTCANGRCIPGELRCDGQDQCGDESDERGCACRSEEMKCADGRCIQKAWLCDGTNDCLDGADEGNCSSCSSAQFLCKDYSCAPAHARCDGVIQCLDGSDENLCVKRVTHGNEENVIVMKKNQSYHHVCFDRWNSSWSNNICNIFGEGKAIDTKSVPIPLNKTNFLLAENENVPFNFSIFQLSASCTTKKAVVVECEYKVCGTTSPSEQNQLTPYVIGGDIAKPKTWPWMVALFFLGSFHCGGSLINSDWVITGAHCFYSSGINLQTVPHYFDVRLSSTKLNDINALKVKVKYVIPHPGFINRNLTNDIALVRLSSPVEYSSSVRPICLPWDTQRLPATALCYTAGWGSSGRGDYRPVDDLREAKMSVWSDASCNQTESWGDLIDHNRTICAGYQSGYIANCYGDSGGPLMCLDTDSSRWVVRGTLRGGQDCGRRSSNHARPSVYSDVAKYSRWIQQTLLLLQ